jgi:hypothetical protein
MHIRRAAQLGLVVIPIALCVALIAFGILGRDAAVTKFVNSDSLLPAHMAWDVLRHDYALANFQWPRVPSLPDLAFFFAMDLLGVDWRIAFLLYGCLIAIALILSLGWVIARVRGGALRDGVNRAGIGVLVALLFASASLAHTPDEARLWLPQLYLFIPVTHGNAMLLSLLASCTALGAIRGSRRQAWTTWGLCALGTFSDTIFLGYFLVPFVLAGAIVAIRRPGQPGTPTVGGLARFLAAAALACAIGWVARTPLVMQEMVLVRPPLDESLGGALADLSRAPWVLGLMIATVVLSARALAGLRSRDDLQTLPVSEIDREWLTLAGLGASLSSLCLAFLLYDNSYAYRYAIPLFWWPVGIAASMVRLPQTGKAGAVLMGIAAAATALPLTSPRCRGGALRSSSACPKTVMRGA